MFYKEISCLIEVFLCQQKSGLRLLHSPPNNDQIEERWQENDGFANPWNSQT